ncbi:hypothetical protein [Niallia oryzisoli]|uniref:hypothetical protein n=1 Tax=Niallia oryzisoli TaxID=1737571 RepID=UPI003735CDDE
MKRKNHLISIKTLTDNHLESFIRCPNQFYHQYILRKKSSGEGTWRQMVEFSVQKIILDYYRLPLKEQNVLNLLKLIDQYREYIHPGLFESKVQYYVTLAKITDHLLLFLTSKQQDEPPLFLFERLQVNVKELNINLSLTFDIGEWFNNRFIVKKYLLDIDERIVTLYKYLLAVFSKKAFGIIPDRIELFSLIDGNRHILSLTEQDVAKGLMYLDLVKGHIQKPGYIKQNDDLPDVQNENHFDLQAASFKTVLH